MAYQKVANVHDCDIIRIGTMVFTELHERDFKKDYFPNDTEKDELPGEVDYDTYVVIHRPTLSMLFAISRPQAHDLALLMETKYTSDGMDLLRLTDDNDVIH